MPSTYTLNNGIELIGTGEQSGTWGDTTNLNLELLDTALDGQVTVTLASAGNSGSPNNLPISDGASSNGRNRLIIFNDGSDLGAAAFVQLTPNDSEKIIYVRNDLSGSRDLTLFQGTYNASNDYVVPAGTTAVVFFDGAGSGAVAANVFNNAFFDSLRLGSVSVTAIIDDDTMGTAAATNIATSESIKAYVDSQVTAQDLDFGGDSGTGAVDLDSQTFTVAGTTNEIETSASGQTLTIGLPDDVTIAGDLTVDTDTLYVDSTNNRVGVGTTSPTNPLQVNGSSGQLFSALADSGAAVVRVDSSNAGSSAYFWARATNTGDSAIQFGDPDDSDIGRITYDHSDDSLAFKTNTSEAMRIDSSQRVLFGTDFTSQSVASGVAPIQSKGTAAASYSALRYTSASSGPFFMFGKTRSTTEGTIGSIVSENDDLGTIRFAGDDGTDLNSWGAVVRAEVDGTPGTNDMPGRLLFETTADGAASSTERMRISEDGTVSIGFASSHPSILRLRQAIDTSANDGTGVLSIQGAASTYSYVMGMDSTGFSIGSTSTSRNMRFVTNSATAMTIDTSQRVLIGLTSDIGTGHKLQVNDDISILSFNGASTGADGIRFIKSRASSPGSNTIVADNDDVGFLDFRVDDGTDYQSRTAVITSSVDGTPGTNDTPGRLTFLTTSDGASAVTERMRIQSDGFVGIGGGGTQAYFPLHVYNNSDGIITRWRKQGATNNPLFEIELTESDSSTILRTSGSSVGPMIFARGSSEAMRIVTNQQILMGATEARTVQGFSHKLQIEGTNASTASISIVRNTNSVDPPYISFGKSRSGSVGGSGIVQQDDVLGRLDFTGANGSNLNEIGVRIDARVDGDPTGSTDMPGRIVFQTSADGGASPSERMRIESTGTVNIGSISSNRSNAALSIYRLGTGYANIRATSNYGASVLLAGASDNTDELRLQQDNVKNGYLYNEANAPIVFGTNNTERVRITNDGMTFNGDTSAGNALSDYEEGTWTPAFVNTFLEGAFASATGFGVITGRYIKVGALVTCWAEIASITGASGNLVGDDNFSFTRASLPYAPTTDGANFDQNGGFLTVYQAVGSANNASGPIICLVGNAAVVAQVTAISNTVSSTSARYQLNLQFKTNS